MPAVPKPGQQVEAKTVKSKKPKAQKIQKEKVQKVPRVSVLASILAQAREHGSMTGAEVRAECTLRNLSKKTTGNYVHYVKKAGLLSA